MSRGESLQLYRKRRRIGWLFGPIFLFCWWAFPYWRAALPAFAAKLDTALCDRFVPRYTARLTALQQENAALRSRLARSELCVTENDALRALLHCSRTPPAAEPARVIRRFAGGAALVANAKTGAAVLDPQGRYAGQVVHCENGECEFWFAGTADAPTAGFSGEYAGLYRHGKLTGLAMPCALTAGQVVATSDGFWLGTLADAPTPAADGLTAEAALADTAAKDCTFYFIVKQA